MWRVVLCVCVCAHPTQKTITFSVVSRKKVNTHTKKTTKKILMDKFEIFEYYIDTIATVRRPVLKKAFDALVPFYRHKFKIYNSGLEKIIVLTANLILCYF